MPILSTPHTHTQFSDGRTTAEEMVLRAIELGCPSIGFSEHSVQPFDSFFTLSKASEHQSALEVVRLRKKYGGKIRIWRGLELDGFGIANRAEYDYVILSQHYVQKDGQQVLHDSFRFKEALFRFRDEVYKGDGAAMAAEHFLWLGDEVKKYRPEIIGHFDLVRMFNTDGALYNAEDPRVKHAAEKALSDILEAGAMLEINTGGMARGYVDDTYPAKGYFPLWREMGGKVILASDSHHPDTLLFGFDTACEWLKEAGFTSVMRLGGLCQPLFVEEEL